MNDTNQIFMPELERPKAGHVATGRRRVNFLPRALQRELKRAAPGTEEEQSIMFVVAILQSQGKMLLGTVGFLQYLFLRACRVDLESVVLFVYRNTSICYDVER